MRKFFGSIRGQLIAENKFTRYLLYAVGEIILVVIGILIALSLNNANLKSLEKEELVLYYKEIAEEMNGIVEDEKHIQEVCALHIDQIISLQKAIKSGNVDSFMKVKSNLSALTYVRTWPRTYPIFKEFIARNYLSKIDNQDLKLGALNLRHLTNAHNNYYEYLMNQYQVNILPFLIKNLNYSELDTTGISVYKGTSGYGKKRIVGGPQINYEKLMNNPELWNLLDLKLTDFESQGSMSAGAAFVFEIFKNSLEEELERLEKD